MQYISEREELSKQMVKDVVKSALRISSAHNKRESANANIAQISHLDLSIFF